MREIRSANKMLTKKKVEKKHHLEDVRVHGWGIKLYNHFCLCHAKTLHKFKYSSDALITTDTGIRSLLWYSTMNHRFSSYTILLQFYSFSYSYCLYRILFSRNSFNSFSEICCDNLIFLDATFNFSFTPKLLFFFLAVRLHFNCPV
jgi:hypothetical protein